MATMVLFGFFIITTLMSPLVICDPTIANYLDYFQGQGQPVTAQTQTYQNQQYYIAQKIQQSQLAQQQQYSHPALQQRYNNPAQQQQFTPPAQQQQYTPPAPVQQQQYTPPAQQQQYTPPAQQQQQYTPPAPPADDEQRQEEGFNVRPNTLPDPAIAAPAQKREDFHEFDYEAVNSGSDQRSTLLPEVSQTVEYPYYVITIKVPIVKKQNYDNPTVIEGKNIVNQYGSNVLFKGFSLPQYVTYPQ